jgi:hypothetical protein
MILQRHAEVLTREAKLRRILIDLTPLAAWMLVAEN